MAINEPLIVKPGASSTGQVLNIFGDQIWVKVTGRESSGELAMIESITPPQGGPPLHRHEREDETFYILEGEFLLEVDGKQHRAGREASPSYLAARFTRFKI
jgi:quercetin dioxygenase-like cupin family protein